MGSETREGLPPTLPPLDRRRQPVTRGCPSRLHRDSLVVPLSAGCGRWEGVERCRVRDVFGLSSNKGSVSLRFWVSALNMTCSLSPTRALEGSATTSIGV